jgi:hypothetical protein
VKRWSILCIVSIVIAMSISATLEAAKKKHKPKAEPAGTPGEPSAPPRNGAVTIAGTVFKNTKPVRGAKVQLKLLRHTGRQRPARGGRHGARTNADGHFTFHAPPGAYSVVASKKGVGTAHLRTVLTANETMGQLRLFLNHRHHHGWRGHRHRHHRH